MVLVVGKFLVVGCVVVVFINLAVVVVAGE